MARNEGRGKDIFRNLLSESSSRPTMLRGGLRVPLGGLGRNRRPDIVRPNVRVHCTKCVFTLMTRTSLQSNSRGSSSDDSYYEGSVGQPVNLDYRAGACW